VKFPSFVYRGMVFTGFSGHTDSHIHSPLWTDKPDYKMPLTPFLNSGRAIKIN